MVKVVRVLFALVTALWYFTSPTGSTTVPHNSPKMKSLELSYYKPLEYNVVKYTSADVSCLAKNIYFEAGAESTAGKLAVANVTINRAIDINYPNTICGVVQEGKHYYNAKKDIYVPVRNRCQFSWYCDGRADDPRPGRIWESTRALAKKVLVNHHDRALIDITDGATHYHANWMEKYPSWSKKKKIMASIDRHIFYKK